VALVLEGLFGHGWTSGVGACVARRARPDGSAAAAGGWSSQAACALWWSM
jgi:hypothetical protein